MKLKLKMGLKAFFTAALFGVMILANAKAATSTSSEPLKGETVVSSQDVTATVQNINYKTREITLKAKDGELYTIVAGENVQRLDQIKKGDTVTASYTEAFVYEINKGGKAIAPTTRTEVSRTTRPGGKPQGMVSREVTSSVVITAIDRKIPSVTFKGAAGNTQTIKVMHPERLNGVNVGDAVDITYTEALALKVDKKVTK
jgi:hypothetical protein